MRVGGMLQKRITFSIVIAPVFVLLLVARANALPIQYLPDIPGYAPVYIRYGNQPLEEINPVLAEAFHETADNNNLNRIQDTPLEETASENTKKYIKDKNDSSIMTKEENISYKTAKLVLKRENNISLQKSKSPDHKFIMMKVSKFLPQKKNNFKKTIEEIKQKE